MKNPGRQGAKEKEKIKRWMIPSRRGPSYGFPDPSYHDNHPFLRTFHYINLEQSDESLHREATEDRVGVTQERRNYLSWGEGGIVREREKGGWVKLMSVSGCDGWGHTVTTFKFQLVKKKKALRRLNSCSVITIGNLYYKSFYYLMESLNKVRLAYVVFTRQKKKSFGKKI